MHQARLNYGKTQSPDNDDPGSKWFLLQRPGLKFLMRVATLSDDHRGLLQSLIGATSNSIGLKPGPKDFALKALRAP